VAHIAATRAVQADWEPIESLIKKMSKRSCSFPQPPRFIDYKAYEPGLSCDERVQRLEAYDAAKKQYHAQLTEYAKQHDYTKLPATKLIALLAVNLIQSTGCKRVMQWRWQQYCEDRPVVRSRNYLKECGLPEYTRFPPVPGMGCLGIPLNVWEHYIFPFLTNVALWHVMLTCKQLQARAHIVLMNRAQQAYGRGGTPMALWCEWNPFRVLHNSGKYNLFTCIKNTLRKYGCMEHCRSFPEFDRRQQKAKEKDREMEEAFVDEVVLRINSIVCNELQIKRYEISTGIHCKWTMFPEYYQRKFNWIYADYLKACQTLINANEENVQRIEKKLATFKSTPVMSAMIRLTNRYDLKKAREDVRIYFFDIIEHQARERGVGWLDQLLNVNEYNLNYNGPLVCIVYTNKIDVEVLPIMPKDEDYEPLLYDILDKLGSNFYFDEQVQAFIELEEPKLKKLKW